MLSDADIKAIKGHLEHSCDCPAHTYVAPLIVELTEARAEARWLRTAAPQQARLQQLRGATSVALVGWRGLASIPERLSRAFADSE